MRQRAKAAVYETAQKVSTRAVVMQIISRLIDGQKSLTMSLLGDINRPYGDFRKEKNYF
jgi:hypothetical protein